MKRKPGFLLFATFIFALNVWASDIVDVQALNSRIILLHFDDGYVRYHQKGESRQNEWVVSEPLDVIKAANNRSYRIEGAAGYYARPRNPVKVTRKSKGTEFTWLCQSYSSSVGCINASSDHATEHWIYLHLSEPLVEGETYRVYTGDVAGNGSEWKLDFTLEKNRSEAIHVNLVGYEPSAPKKYGYVYHWSGEDGGIDFRDYNGNSFYLIDTQTNEKVFSGKLTFRKNRFNKETNQQNDTPNQNFLGADVYECDFSEFNTPGEYVLAVEGIGRSFPFRIKKDIYRLPFYTSVRGLYHNRSGIALEEPFTEYTRPAPHNPLVTPGFAGKLKYTTSRFVDWNEENNSPSDKQAIEDGILGPVNTWGWYQDAGDWDGYFSHLKIPAMLMLTWEIAPEKFADGELNLPEGVNQIPDILDEARWLIRFFYRTRHELMDKGYGTGGVGSRVAPDWFGHAGDGTPSYLDNGKWVISGEDPFTTYFYAGLAAHYQLILQKLGVADPENIDWAAEAAEAFDWAKNNTKPDDTNPNKVLGYKLSDFQMYAAATLFRLTGDEKYENTVLQTGKNITASTIIGEDQKWGAYSLITGNEYVIGDSVFVTKLKNAVMATAEQKYSSVNKRACRYGGDLYMPMLVGQGTTPRVFELMMGHFLSKDFAPDKTENYLAALFTTADYFLGCNPLNMAYITHVGVRYPERVMHIDSWYNDWGEMVPGITPYGPWRDQNTSNAIGPWDLHWPYKTLFPEGIENWPGHERWFNNYTTPLNAEFTVHQNTVLSAVVYGYLCNVPDGSFQPNKRPAVNIVSPTGDSENGGNITIDVQVSDPNGDEDIAWVEFYNGWHKVGESHKAPFRFTWEKPKYGEAKISAKVVDKSGFSANSDTVNIIAVPINYDVTIVVKDSVKTKNIPGCKVTIGDTSIITDENGEAGFKQIPGLFNVRLEHKNYLPLSVSNISVYSDTVLVFYPEQKKNEVTFVIHNSEDGTGFSGVPVTFNSELKITNQYGEASFEAYEGNYDFLVEKNNFQPEAGNVEILSDTVFHFFLVRTEAEIKFVLKDGTTPVNNASVVLNATDTLISSALGIARFKDRELNQSYDFHIFKTGYDDVFGTLLLKTDTTVNIPMRKIPVGNSDVNTAEMLRIWPNPAGKIVHIQSTRPISKMTLFAISGSKIHPEYNEVAGVVQFDISTIPNGIYLIKIEFAEGDLKMIKLVKN